MKTKKNISRMLFVLIAALMPGIDCVPPEAEENAPPLFPFGPEGPPRELHNVHGAGAQRSDPKTGNPDDYAFGFGPQGDDIRIYNYARCVRGSSASANDYTIVDTGVSTFYDNADTIGAPVSGADFYGQDATYSGNAPDYTDNGDGTVTDNNTGLMWQKTPNSNVKVSYADAVNGAAAQTTGGYSDWRLPTVKELYSLMDFNGSSQSEIGYIDTTYFDFQFGNEAAGERLIDSQYWTATEYVGRVMDNRSAVFGVNFADGRIKGYPDSLPDGSRKLNFVRYVRGATGYGVNDFADNGDGTVSDNATGLMWMQADNGSAISWQAALAYCENLSFAGQSDWRLPDPKELHSIVDYTRAPDASDPDKQTAAIDPIFTVTETESYFWTGTTLLEAPPFLASGSHAVYIAFGRAMGFGPSFP